jgi:dTDP-4-dehydrorhamnose reductase
MIAVLFGASGILGTAIRDMKPCDAILFTSSSQMLDVSDQVAVCKYLKEINPDVIINACAVKPRQLNMFGEEYCIKVNVELPKTIFSFTEAYGGFYVHASSDSVFDGNIRGPFPDSCVPSPVSQYSRLKRDAELCIHEQTASSAVVRFGPLIGASRSSHNTIRSILNNLDSGVLMRPDNINAYSFCVSHDLAACIWRICSERRGGTFHFSNSDFYSWSNIFSYLYYYFIGKLNNEVDGGELPYQDRRLVPSSIDWCVSKPFPIALSNYTKMYSKHEF